MEKVLVLEPTRFLCDQMYSTIWRKLFGDIVGKEYEGRCTNFLDKHKKIILSTPITALKCIQAIGGNFNVLIIDEVHKTSNSVSDNRKKVKNDSTLPFQ